LDWVDWNERPAGRPDFVILSWDASIALMVGSRQTYDEVGFTLRCGNVLEFDWENSVGYWICSTSHLLRRALSTRLQEERMTLRQWEVLAMLSRCGACSQTQIAVCLGIEPHTLTGVVSRMERDGWLERVPCPKDRRRYTVHPTRRAERVWARAAEFCREVRKKALDGFTEEEVKSFKNMCGRIQKNLEDSTPEELEDPCGGAAVASSRGSTEAVGVGVVAR
jgi:MarR family transcriptional regulator for hemolysin